MEKKKKKFGTRNVLIFVISGVFGGLMGAIIASGIFHLPSQYKALPMFVNGMIIIFTYILAVSVHEIGHAIGFVKNGINMRALFITMFLFIKEKEGWKFKLRPNNVTFMGGIAIPNLDVVKDESDFKRLQKAYAKAIIAGPLTSIILWIVAAIIILPIMPMVTNIYIKSTLFVFIAGLTMITLFLLITCIFKSEIAVGDFPAYTLAKNDSFFVAIQLYQYALFTLEPDRIRSQNTYIKGVLYTGLSEKLKEQDIHLFTLNIIDTFIIEYLAGVSSELSQVVRDYIDFLLDYPEKLRELKNSEAALLLRFHIIRLLYIEENTKKRAVELYNELKKDIKKKTPVTKYMTKQIEHVLGLADNSQYLQNKANIRISAAHGLWKNFEGYFIDEMRLNQMANHKQEIRNM